MSCSLVILLLGMRLALVHNFVDHQDPHDTKYTSMLRRDLTRKGLSHRSRCSHHGYLDHDGIVSCCLGRATVDFDSCLYNMLFN